MIIEKSAVHKTSLLPYNKAIRHEEEKNID